ncbi:MAG: hypothetical protein EBU46_11045 [Nitrosomonadaceae bacterium]|nr:hypothetical protein [Nitrosomonadaceae bacterium]
MIHAYQTGKLKGRAPAMVRGMAATISPTSVDHFAKTKQRGLPEHVKTAKAKRGTLADDFHSGRYDTPFRGSPEAFVKRFPEFKKTAFWRGFNKAASR